MPWPSIFMPKRDLTGIKYHLNERDQKASIITGRNCMLFPVLLQSTANTLRFILFFDIMIYKLISLVVNYARDRGDTMAESYGQVLCDARKFHDPPMTAKELADALEVKPPFITDIEKGRRLPSLDTQKKIKKLLSCDKYPEYLFDDLAAVSNPDPRIVAEDLSQAIRAKTELRKLIRIIIEQQWTNKEIECLIANIGGPNHDAE